MTKGPREPGVGAELISPTESLSYENELDKLSLSRINSLASSEPDIDERAQDFEVIEETYQKKTEFCLQKHLLIKLNFFVFFFSK